jgi:hypothetical protein
MPSIAWNIQDNRTLYPNNEFHNLFTMGVPPQCRHSGVKKFIFILNGKKRYIYLSHDLCYVKAFGFQHRLDGKLHGSCLSNKINHKYLLYISVKWKKHNIKIEIFNLVISKGGEIRKIKLKNILHLNESWNRMKLILHWILW